MSFPKSCCARSCAPRQARQQVQWPSATQDAYTSFTFPEFAPKASAGKTLVQSKHSHCKPFCFRSCFASSRLFSLKCTSPKTLACQLAQICSFECSWVPVLKTPDLPEAVLNTAWLQGRVACQDGLPLRRVGSEGTLSEHICTYIYAGMLE